MWNGRGWSGLIGEISTSATDVSLGFTVCIKLDGKVQESGRVLKCVTGSPHFEYVILS